MRVRNPLFRDKLDMLVRPRLQGIIPLQPVQIERERAVVWKVFLRPLLPLLSLAASRLPGKEKEVNPNLAGEGKRN